MTTRYLTEAILDGGIRSVNFFNGRLLSGEDLSQEQEANSEERKRLGQAIGDGIVSGLEVAKSTTTGNSGLPVVTIQPGLAINRLGQTLVLTKSVDVSLVSSNAGATTSTQSLFVTCTPPQSGPYIAGAGVYLLTIAPAIGSEGRTPVSGLGNVGAFCNTRYNIEGVQFHLLQVNIPQSELQDSDRLRNRLAYACFGTSDPLVQTFFQNPLGSSVQQGYGLLDTMRQGNSTGAACLSDTDVPLALLYWTVDAGIAFIDLWSVRRRITRPSADTRWPLFISDRRLSEAEAMFLQFEEHVQDIIAGGPNTLSTLAAMQHFAYLPPLGILPLQRTGSAPGFDPNAFFRTLASSNLEMTDGNLLRTLMHEAMYHEPINLADTSRANRVQLYTVWENVQAFTGLVTDQLVFVFASHTLPYRGVARFGYANFDISRFAPTVK
ncbi:MAG TPA: hypothetical protein VFA10_29605 [Ktedonobacteraceae bacterium]|nr:hypothetical protein [Ktedonobacteraceae bacterium]